jgi:hypothetical protein
MMKTQAAGPGVSELIIATGQDSPQTANFELRVSGAPRAEMLSGRIEGFDHDGHALVAWEGMREALPQKAETVVPLGQKDLHRRVLLAFAVIENAVRPVIMGLLQKPSPLPPRESAPVGGWDVETDGKRMVLAAQEEITLRCGKASITLTRAGKVVLTGEYLLSRSTGVNRIKGGSVQIN